VVATPHPFGELPYQGANSLSDRRGGPRSGGEVVKKSPPLRGAPLKRGKNFPSF